jgi:hypothetical protein
MGRSLAPKGLWDVAMGEAQRNPWNSADHHASRMEVDEYKSADSLEVAQRKNVHSQGGQTSMTLINLLRVPLRSTRSYTLRPRWGRPPHFESRTFRQFSFPFPSAYSHTVTLILRTPQALAVCRSGNSTSRRLPLIFPPRSSTGTI